MTCVSLICILKLTFIARLYWYGPKSSDVAREGLRRKAHWNLDTQEVVLGRLLFAAVLELDTTFF